LRVVRPSRVSVLMPAHKARAPYEPLQRAHMFVFPPPHSIMSALAEGAEREDERGVWGGGSGRG